ncbi:MAG: TatD family hydrolase [Clostridia bacterium]|nr:TatD family hydrolase [Clostridia bacterium]
MSRIFDSHAHYDDPRFDEDRQALLSSLPSKGIVGVITCGTDIVTSQKSLKIAEKYPYIKAACGIYPGEADKIAPGDFASLSEMLKNKNCVAIGEIGLEYHYDDVPRATQLACFEKQLKMAVYLDMPVIVHDREAHEDTMRLLRKYKPKGVLHCYSGSVEMLKEIVKLGMYIGLGGAVTFKNAQKPLEAASFVPLDRLLVETDAPYMSPVPFRGKRCDSSMIAYSAAKIAEARGMEVDALLAATAENARRLFQI